jgi:hypothetical protein
MSFFRLTPLTLIIPALASSVALDWMQPSLAASLLPDTTNTVGSLPDINFNSLLLQENETQFVLKILVQDVPFQKSQSSAPQQTASSPSVRGDVANNLSLDFWVRRLKQIQWFGDTKSSQPIEILPQTSDSDINEGVYTFKPSNDSSPSDQNSSSSKFNNPFQEKSSLFGNPFPEKKANLENPFSKNDSVANNPLYKSQQTAIDNPFEESYLKSNNVANNPLLNSASVFDNPFLKATTGVDNALATETKSFSFSENTASTGSVSTLGNNFLQPIRAARALKNRSEGTPIEGRIALASQAKYKKMEAGDIDPSVNNVVEAFTKQRKKVQFDLVPDKNGLKTTLGINYQISLSEVVGKLDGSYSLALNTELPRLPTPMVITEKNLTLSDFGASKLTEVTTLAGYGINEQVRRKIRKEQKEALEKIQQQEKARYQRLLAESRSTLSQLQSPLSAASANYPAPAATLPSKFSLTVPSSVPQPLRTTPRDFY